MTQSAPSKPKTLTELHAMSVLDFFCPAETRSCPPVMAKRVYDACFAASIQTVGDLSSKTPDQLRSMTFSEELIPYIAVQFQWAHAGLNLAHKPGSSHGKIAAISFLPTEDSTGSNAFKYGS